MSLFKQSLSLGTVLILVFIWEKLPLDNVTVPALGVLSVMYLLLYQLSKRWAKITLFLSSISESASILLLIGIVLILVLSTGGLFSPVFFLLYFLPFAIAFIFLPATAFVYLLGVIFLFAGVGFWDNVTESVIKVGSLILISPLAYFFGKEYRVVTSHQRKDFEIAQKIKTEASDVLRDQEQTLPEKDKEELAAIISDTEKLKE